MTSQDWDTESIYALKFVERWCYLGNDLDPAIRTDTNFAYAQFKVAAYAQCMEEIEKKAAAEKENARASR